MIDEPIGLRVRRIGAPRWAKEGSDSMPGLADMYALSGEQPEWGWGIPLVHRAMASPSEGLPVPRKPVEGCHFSNALGYWAALLHVCLYSLGWVRPETGLFRLLESVDSEFDDVVYFDEGFGAAEADPRLQLLRSVWLHDGDLAFFVAWLSRFDLGQYRSLLGEITGQRFDQWTFEVDRWWVEHQAERAARLRYPTPAPGGDPLHLSGHCYGPLNDLSPHEERRRRNHFAVHDNGTATLTVTSMQGWYRTLLSSTSELFSRGEELAVDVYSQPVGWLGTYRKSPATGIWHAASEDAHLLGY